MNGLRLLATLLVALWVVSPASANTAETGEITTYLEEVETPDFILQPNQGLGDEIGWEEPFDPIPIPDDFDLPLPIPGPIGGSDKLIIVEQILNIGERVWKFIEDNKPVINVQRSFANALPRGVKSSDELDGFSSMQYRSFRMYGKNWMNKIVYDITFTLSHRFGGNIDGVGNYLEHVTVLPHKVEASWGYTIDVMVEAIGAVNVGTKETPVGGLTLELAVKISTIFKASEFRSLYEFRGDSRDVATINGDGRDENDKVKHVVEPFKK